MMKVYTAARTVTKCYGHGDFGKEQVIEQTGSYGIGGFPPIFTSELLCRAWIEDQFGSYEIVDLEVVF